MSRSPPAELADRCLSAGSESPGATLASVAAVMRKRLVSPGDGSLRCTTGGWLPTNFDGKIIWAPIIEARSFPGSGEVARNFTKEFADELAAELNSGPLPVDVERVASSK